MTQKLKRWHWKACRSNTMHQNSVALYENNVVFYMDRKKRLKEITQAEHKIKRSHYRWQANVAGFTSCFLAMKYWWRRSRKGIFIDKISTWLSTVTWTSTGGFLRTIKMWNNPAPWRTTLCQPFPYRWPEISRKVSQINKLWNDQRHAVKDLCDFVVVNAFKCHYCKYHVYVCHYH